MTIRQPRWNQYQDPVEEELLADEEKEKSKNTNKNNFKDDHEEKKVFRFHIERKAGENLCLFALSFPFFSFSRSLLGDNADIYDYSKDFHFSLQTLLCFVKLFFPSSFN